VQVSRLASLSRAAGSAGDSFADEFDTLDADEDFANAYPCEERDGYAYGCMCRSRARGGLRRVSCRRCRRCRSFGEGFGGASDGGAAVQCGPRDHRADGPGAWAVCAPGVVVAFGASIHEKTKHFEPIRRGARRAECGVPDVGACAQREQRCRTSCWASMASRWTTTIDFVLPNRRYETIRAGTSGLPA
jgi:hypothetical protein